MSQQKLVSIDLRADFGFFKKPDLNDGILLTYNMIHKPSLIGIFGAVIGLGGYQRKGEFPEYYHAFKDLPVGIEPLAHEQGNYQKTAVKYTNTVGYANADGTLLVEEMMLVRPAYRCYALLDLKVPDQSKLYVYLKEGEAEYVPYFGKNEYQACWLDEEGEVSFREYEFEEVEKLDSAVKVASLFTIDSLKDSRENEDDEADNPYDFYDVGLTLKKAEESPFAYFERLPIGFNQQLIQYHIVKQVFTNFLIKAEKQLPNLYRIILNGEQQYVQLL